MTNMPSTEVSLPLDLTDVQTSLRALWASEQMRAMAIVRARTHNLIIFAEPETAQEVARFSVDIAINYPGRIIRLDIDDSLFGLDGTVSAYCREEGSKEVCGELISLRTAGSSLDDAHSTIVSLLVPDLPVYLWWNDAPPAADHLFEEIAPLTDRLIFDSNAFPDPTGGLQALAQLQGYNISDLNWNRITSWRQLMAQLYDVPEVRNQMKSLRSLDVHYVANEEPHNPNRALLMIGWLASRLGWTLNQAKIGKTGGYIFKFDTVADQPSVKVEVVEGHSSSLEEGDLTGVFVKAGSSVPYLLPRLVIGEQMDCLEMHLIESETADPTNIVSYSAQNYAELMAEELNFDYDPDYAQALAAAGNLLAAVS